MAILSLIYNPAIREMGRDLAPMLPKYWEHVAASSSGKYHPVFALGEGGLLRHSVLVAYFCHRLALSRGLNQYWHDVVVLAGLLHDGLKQGLGEGGHTVHEHPILAAEWLRGFNNSILDDVAHVIETHMGVFVTSKYSSVRLEEPIDDNQKLLSDADMLAATPELDFDFDRMVESIREEVAKRG